MANEKLMVIDGNSIINRAFYGIGLLSNSEGVYTNAILGFLNIFFKYMEEENPDYICVTFDMKAPTFRHKAFKEYKAHRKGMPEELAMQMPLLKEVLKAMNINILEKEGYEADDIIGTVSKVCQQEDVGCIIITGDKDSLQLATDTTIIKLPVTKKGTTITERYDSNAVFEKYGVTPTEFIDVKGLMGDPSDNIPGVPSVGEKTALSLIKEYKSIENIYKEIDLINTRKNVKENLINNKEMAFLSKELSTIDTNVPIDINLNNCGIKKEYDNKSLLKILKKLEFKSYIQKLNLEDDQDTVAFDEENYVHAITLEEIKKIVNTIIISKKMTYILYVDTDGDTEKIISMAVTSNGDLWSYIDINSQFPETKFIKVFKPVFENKDIEKIGYGMKDDIVILNSYGINIINITFDCMIASYILNPTKSSYNIEEIAYEFIGVTVPSEEAVLGKGKAQLCIKEIEEESAVRFACMQLEAIYKLSEILKEKIEEHGQKELYYNIELPLITVLADMQIAGFKVDKEKLMEFSQKLNGRIGILSHDIHAISGEEFNINSPKQLGVILFEKLGLPVIKKTKTGYSTNVEVLEKLKDKHEIIELLMEYRQLVKLKSTYADGLINVINANTGKIHSNFNQTITATGRISSTEPNLQNIPIRLDLGREVRKMFTPSNDEYVLIDADYSQIELRVLAHISNDPNMINAFKNNEDIHTTTASQVFEVPADEVTPTMRSGAKAVNFGIVYGIGDFSLSQDLGITKKEAKSYIDNYLKKYSMVDKYMEDIVETGKTQGYVTTLLNRRRYIPELKSTSFFTRSFGERIAMNTPIQGSAADIIKIAMVNVHKELKDRDLKSRIILQVHDELIVETHKSEIEIVKEIVRNQMESAVQLTVPLTIDLSIGDNWYDVK